jgi:hypothetical protein
MASYTTTIDHASVTVTTVISERDAKRIVNQQLLEKKVSGLVLAGKPTLFVDQEHAQVCWKVPFIVSPPPNDPHTYPTGFYVMVNASKGQYTMTDDDVKQIKAAARPITAKLQDSRDQYLRRLKKEKTGHDSCSA